jgi:hypothetical protein
MLLTARKICYLDVAAHKGGAAGRLDHAVGPVQRGCAVPECGHSGFQMEFHFSWRSLRFRLRAEQRHIVDRRRLKYFFLPICCSRNMFSYPKLSDRYHGSILTRI